MQARAKEIIKESLCKQKVKSPEKAGMSGKGSGGTAHGVGKESQARAHADGDEEGDEIARKHADSLSHTSHK